MRINAKVKGKYHDIDFTGHVSDIEGSTQYVNADRINVTLDTPIEVYGVVRGGIVITNDGTRGYSYVEAA